MNVINRNRNKYFYYLFIFVIFFFCFTFTKVALAETKTYTLFSSADSGNSGFSEAGDASAQLTAWNLYGVNASNTANGNIYWNLLDIGGAKTLRLYKDSAKTQLVAEGAGTGSNVAINEMNGSGLRATVNITYTVDDTDSVNILSHGFGSSGSILYAPYGTEENRFGFFRFKINIPKNAHIDSAYLSLVASSTANSNSSVMLSLLDETDSATFGSGANNPILRNISVSATGTIGAWIMNQRYDANGVGGTPDIKDLVQSYIDRPDYNYFDYLGLRLKRDGNTNNKLAYGAYATSDESIWPELIVNYSGGDPTLDVYMADPEVRSKQYAYVQLNNTTNTQKLKVTLDGSNVHTKPSGLAGQSSAGEEKVLLNYTSLTAGSHTLRFVITDINDAEYSSSVYTKTWTTLHNGAPATALNENNALEIKGENGVSVPFFPLSEFMSSPNTWKNHPVVGDKRIDWFNTSTNLGSSGYFTLSADGSSIIGKIAQASKFLIDTAVSSSAGSTQTPPQTFKIIGPQTGGEYSWDGFSIKWPRYSILNFSFNETAEGSSFSQGLCSNTPSPCWATSTLGVNPDYTADPLDGSQSILLDGTVTGGGEATATLSIPSQPFVGEGLGRVKQKFIIKDKTAGGLQTTDIIRWLNPAGDVLGKVKWNADGTFTLYHGTTTATTSLSYLTDTKYTIWVEWEQRRVGSADGRIYFSISSTGIKPSNTQAQIETGSGSPGMNGTNFANYMATQIQWVAQSSSTIVLDDLVDNTDDMKAFITSLKDPDTYTSLLGWVFEDEPDMGGQTGKNTSHTKWKEYIHTLDTNHPFFGMFYGSNYKYPTYTASEEADGKELLYMYNEDQNNGVKTLPADSFSFDNYLFHYSEKTGYPDFETAMSAFDYVVNGQYDLIPVSLVMEDEDLSDNMCLGLVHTNYFFENCPNSEINNNSWTSNVPIQNVSGGNFLPSRKLSKVKWGTNSPSYVAISDHVSSLTNQPPNPSYWALSSGATESWTPNISYVAANRPRYVKVTRDGVEVGKAEILDVRMTETDQRFADYYPKPNGIYNDHLVIRKMGVDPTLWEVALGDVITEYTDSGCTSATGVSAVVGGDSSKVPYVATEDVMHTSKLRPNGGTARIYWTPMPTSEEYKNVAWLTIIHGAKAVFNFPYHTEYYYRLRTPLADLKNLIEGTGPISQALGPVVLQAPSTRVISSEMAGWADANTVGNARVDYTAREFGGKTYVFAGRVYKHTGDQTTPDTATMNITGLTNGASVAVLGESRNIIANNGSFEDTFAINDIHIYELDSTIPSDGTAPIVSITSPTTGSSATGTITLTASANDPTVDGQTTSGVAGVLFKLNGTSICSEVIDSPYTCQWSTTQTTDGTYTLTAVARDVAGNFATSSPVSITVNNTEVVPTYYIDYDNGEDSNDGISTATPWKHSPGDTNATGNASATSLVASSTVIFKGGVQYIGTITLNWSGSSGNPILYDGNSAGNWGTGKAIIGGDYSTTYGFYMPTGKSYLNFNNLEFYKIGGLADYTGYDCSANPLPSKPGYGFYLIDSSYITISNSYFHELGYWQNASPVNFAGSGMGGYGVYVFGTDHLVVNNNEFTKMEKPIRVSPGQYGSVKTATNVQISNNNIHNYIRWMIELSTGMDNTTLQDISIYGNILHDFTEYDGSNWTGCGVAPHTDGIIMGVSNYVGRTYGSPTHPIRVYNNLFYQNATSGGGTAMIFLTGMGGTLYIYNNVFMNALHGDGNIYAQDGVTVSSGDTLPDYHFYNNTFYDSDYSIFLRNIAGANYALNLGTIRIKNNIFYHSGASAAYPVEIYDDYSTPTELDYNLYYTDRVDQAVLDWRSNVLRSQSVSGMRSSYGWETHGIQTNPTFTNISYGLGLNSSQNNLQIQSSSLAKDAGVSLASYFTTDYVGTSRPQGSAWDMGAYEYLVSSPTYTIGGTISGLTGTVILQNNLGNNKSISSNGSFTFTTALSNSASYAVTVLTQPTNQICTVGSGSGTVSSANVTSVTVTCTNNTKSITSFTIPNQTSSTINDTDHTIAVVMPYGTNVTALVPTILIIGSSTSPLSGVAQNFTSPVIYTVTAQDTSTTTYACLLYTSPSPRDRQKSRMPSSA